MTLRSALRYAASAIVVIGLSACGADKSTGVVQVGPGADAYIRYINNVYAEEPPGPSTVTATTDPDDGSTRTLIVTPVTYTQVPVDVLIDSSTTAPSVVGLAPTTLSAGITGAAPARLATASFTPVSHGVHSFVARRAGLTPKPGFSLFTTPGSSGPRQYLPKLYLTGNTFYTFGIAGIIAPPVNDTQVVNPPTGVKFEPAVDDPFSPPTVFVNGERVFQARFRVYNFATFMGTSGRSEQIGVFVTEGSTPPSTVENLRAATIGIPFNESGIGQDHYANVQAGTYCITLAYSGIPQKIAWSGVVTFKPGELRSFFLVNDMPTFNVIKRRIVTTDATGQVIGDISFNQSSPATVKVIQTLDNQY